MHDEDPPTVSSQILSAPGSVPERDENPKKFQDDSAGPGVVRESKSDWKSTTYATTKLAINLVKESSDAFPPLKSVVGGLSAILDHCDVRFVSPEPNNSSRSWHSQQTVACRQTIESLMPRVEQLAESLSKPAPEGETGEEERREILKRYLTPSDVDALQLTYTAFQETG